VIRQVEALESLDLYFVDKINAIQTLSEYD